MRQDPRISALFDQISAEYVVPVQAAGLPVGIIAACKADALSPDDLRRSLTRQLQATLPKSVPLAVLTDATATSREAFARTEARVKETVLQVASAGPVLRQVVTHDRTGREITEFYGAKSSWMNQFKRPLQIMKSLGAKKY